MYLHRMFYRTKCYTVYNTSQSKEQNKYKDLNTLEQKYLRSNLTDFNREKSWAEFWSGSWLKREIRFPLFILIIKIPVLSSFN